MVSTRAHDTDYVDSPSQSQSQSYPHTASQRRGRSRSQHVASASPQPALTPGPSQTHYDLRATPQRQRSTTPQAAAVPPPSPRSPGLPGSAARTRTPRSLAKAPAGTPASRRGRQVAASTPTPKQVVVEVPRVRGLESGGSSADLESHFLPPVPPPRSAVDGESQSSASGLDGEAESSMTLSGDGDALSQATESAGTASSPHPAGPVDVVVDHAADLLASDRIDEQPEAETSGEVASVVEREAAQAQQVTESNGAAEEEDEDELEGQELDQEQGDEEEDEDEEDEEDDSSEEESSDSDSASDSDADSASTSASTIVPSTPTADDLDALLQEALQTAQARTQADKAGAEAVDAFQADVMQLEKAPRRERPIPGLTVPYLPPKLLNVPDRQQERRMDKGKAKAVEQDVAASAGTRKVTDMEVDDAVYEPQLSRSQKLRLPKTQSTNEAWASLPAIPSALLPQLKRDYQALSLSNSLDPKRFMKGGNAKGKVPEKFAIGTLINPPRHLQSSTVSTTPTYRPGSVVSSLVSDAEIGSYAKRKFGELQGKRIENGRRQGWKKRRGGW